MSRGERADERRAVGREEVGDGVAIRSVSRTRMHDATRPGLHLRGVSRARASVSAIPAETPMVWRGDVDEGEGEQADSAGRAGAPASARLTSVTTSSRPSRRTPTRGRAAARPTLKPRPADSPSRASREIPDESA